jgi:prepilin-type N-terminal cleavage/methylation domain-containing protein
LRRHCKNVRGYSLAELLTVVAIVGVVTLVTIPAFLQLMPQYRIRSASTELSAALRMTRQDAIGTRRQWRVTIDGAGKRYAISMLTTPGSDMKVSTNWTHIGENNRPVPSGAPWWKQLSSDIQLSTTGFNDIDCANGADVIFQRDGTIAPDFNNSCTAGGSALIDFSTPPKIRVYYPSQYVRYNAYYIYGSAGGNLTTDQTKE